jgi:sugar (pentulose or hexulose) kinase
MSLYVGIDIGTSACRACAIDARAALLADARCPLPAAQRTPLGAQQDPAIWWQALQDCLDTLCRQVDARRIRRLAVDATSSTLLLCRSDGTPLGPGLMYNDARATGAAALIERHAPPQSPARGAASSLAKCLHLAADQADGDWRALHQADWLSGALSGDFRYGDENNALKLGYDIEHRRWPAWLAGLPLDTRRLPRVVPPGTPIGRLRPLLAQRWGCGPDVTVVAGTTDSTASFIAAARGATGARPPATAVTVLGSTLVLKVLSERPVSAARYGIYSHRLGDRWLVGGASNAGGAVLQALFTACDIKRFTRLLQPTVDTGLDYYPLPATGERFPLRDPQMQPRLQPRPASDAQFFQGILEGLAAIEARGYRLLAELGAPYPSRVLTAGGGAPNRGWQQIRARRLQVPVVPAQHQEAAYGAALLAFHGQALFAHP